MAQEPGSSSEEPRHGAGVPGHVGGPELGLLAPILAPIPALLLALIVVGLALELRLVFHLNVNWDEFHFLSRIYEHHRGALPYRLQTFHVQLFGWLPLVSNSEVDQVVAARTVLFALGLGSRALLYAIGRHFLSRAGSLFVVLAYGSFSYVLHHGASFRFDPLCSFLVLTALALLLSERSRPALGLRTALAGLALAVSAMISLKTAVMAPTIGVTLAYACARDGRGLRDALLPLAGFSVCLGAGFGALYALHATSLAADSFDAGAFLGRVSTSFLVLDRLFPRASYLLQSFRWDGLTWSLLGLGTVWTAAGLRRPAGRAKRLVLLGFLLPLLALLVYRNAFPYFYVLMLPPALVLCAVPVSALETRLGPGSLRSGALVAAAGLAVFTAGLRFHWANRSDQTPVQRELVAAVHELFPYPVPYIDRCAMIASYPKAGMFMSAWSMDDYRATRQPVMRELIAAEQPVFVVANGAGLTHALARRVAPPPVGRQLLDEDNRALRENYIWHWGMLYVAGKRFAFGLEAAAQSFELLIPGLYTVEAPVPVHVDGVAHAPDTQVWLEAGSHTIDVTRGPARVALRWGTALRVPERPARRERAFTGFTYK